MMKQNGHSCTPLLLILLFNIYRTSQKALNAHNKAFQVRMDLKVVRRRQTNTTQRSVLHYSRGSLRRSPVLIWLDTVRSTTSSVFINGQKKKKKSKQCCAVQCLNVWEEGVRFFHLKISFISASRRLSSPPIFWKCGGQMIHSKKEEEEEEVYIC